MIGKRKNRSINGITLIEIAVVIIILSVFIAGAATMSSLKNQYKLRAIVQDLENYQNAITNFRDIYKAFPGDYNDASGELGLGGDGDGAVEFATSNNNPVEDIVAWYQLRRAGLIKGKYGGVAVSGNRYDITGSTPNAPSTYFDSGVYAIATDTTTYYGKSGTYISLGAISNGLPHEDYLTPIDARFIDEKIDDTLASRGRLYTVRGESARIANSGCVDGAITASSANYLVGTNSQNKTCIILLWQK